LAQSDFDNPISPEPTPRSRSLTMARQPVETRHANRRREFHSGG
jgi:hypothetical protein